MGCGALVEYAPDPPRLVWVLLLATAAAGLVAVVALPEIAARRPGAVASPVPRLGVPRRLRRDVSPLAPILVASWALGGLYLSFGPSVAARVLGVTGHLGGGLVVALCGVLAGPGRPDRGSPCSGTAGSSSRSGWSPRACGRPGTRSPRRPTVVTTGLSNNPVRRCAP